MKKLSLDFLSDEDTEKFCEWAFGSEYLRFRTAVEYLTAWRDLHANLYYLWWHESFDKDITIMVELWRDHVEESKSSRKNMQ